MTNKKELRAVLDAVPPPPENHLRLLLVSVISDRRVAATVSRKVYRQLWEN